MERFYSLNRYLKETFGEKVYRLSLDGGMTCPNRDGTLGTKGCIFCSEGGSGDFAAASSFRYAGGLPMTDFRCSVSSQLNEAKKQVQSKTNCKKFIAYFQAFTNTYAPVPYLRQIFTEAMALDEIVVLSIGTRADCISDEVLALLTELNRKKPVWIELGIQSMHQRTHDLIQSGLEVSCFEDTITRLSNAGIPVICHLIYGLPGETKEDMLKSLHDISALPIAGLKLQLLHILKNTALADLYEKEPFHVLTLEEYTGLITESIGRLRPDIVLHRITGDGPKKLLIAPLWSADKKKVLNTIQHSLKEQDIWQGKYITADCQKPITTQIRSFSHGRTLHHL